MKLFNTDMKLRSWEVVVMVALVLASLTIFGCDRETSGPQIEMEQLDGLALPYDDPRLVRVCYDNVNVKELFEYADLRYQTGDFEFEEVSAMEVTQNCVHFRVDVENVLVGYQFIPAPYDAKWFSELPSMTIGGTPRALHGAVGLKVHSSLPSYFFDRMECEKQALVNTGGTCHYFDNSTEEIEDCSCRQIGGVQGLTCNYVFRDPQGVELDHFSLSVACIKTLCVDGHCEDPKFYACDKQNVECDFTQLL